MFSSEMNSRVSASGSSDSVMPVQLDLVDRRVAEREVDPGLQQPGEVAFA